MRQPVEHRRSNWIQLPHGFLRLPHERTKSEEELSGYFFRQKTFILSHSQIFCERGGSCFAMLWERTWRLLWGLGQILLHLTDLPTPTSSIYNEIAVFHIKYKSSKPDCQNSNPGWLSVCPREGAACSSALSISVGWAIKMRSNGSFTVSPLLLPSSPLLSPFCPPSFRDVNPPFARVRPSVPSVQLPHIIPLTAACSHSYEGGRMGSGKNCFGHMEGNVDGEEFKVKLLWAWSAAKERHGEYRAHAIITLHFSNVGGNSGLKDAKQ